MCCNLFQFLSSNYGIRRAYGSWPRPLQCNSYYLSLLFQSSLFSFEFSRRITGWICFVALRVNLRKSTILRLTVYCNPFLRIYILPLFWTSKLNNNSSRMLPFLLKFFLFHSTVKSIALIVFTVWTCVSIFFIPNISIGLDQQLTMATDSYVYKYFKVREEWYICDLQENALFFKSMSVAKRWWQINYLWDHLFIGCLEQN